MNDGEARGHNVGTSGSNISRTSTTSGSSAGNIITTATGRYNDRKSLGLVQRALCDETRVMMTRVVRCAHLRSSALLCANSMVPRLNLLFFGGLSGVTAASPLPPPNPSPAAPSTNGVVISHAPPSTDHVNIIRSVLWMFLFTAIYEYPRLSEF